MIRAENIKKIYRMGAERLEVLKGVTLEISEGEFVSIMGPSGSGKSTLMHILGLLDKPTFGRLFIYGKDVSSLSDFELAQLRSKTIGFVFQQFNLLPKMTAYENVSLPQIYLGEKRKRNMATDFLKSVGLEERMNHRPNELSGGQQQRVSIARALVNNPKIIFADEPTGNLASAQSEEIMKIFRNLNRKGITVVVVTHEKDVAGCAGRIINLKDGEIVSDSGGRRQAETKHLYIKKKSRINLYEIAENFNSAAKAIVANKMRSFMTMLGIIIGVSALITMLAVGYGAQKSLEGMMSSLGTNLLIMMPQDRKLAGASLGAGEVSRLDGRDVEAIKAVVPHISRMDANVSGRAQAVYKANNIRTSITGATANYAAMRNSKPVYGRFFTNRELENMEKVAVIGQTVAENLFGEENPLGKVIKIKRRNFRVIGVLPLKGASGPSNRDDVIIVPLTTAMKSLLGRKYYQAIVIEVAEREKMPFVQEKLVELMRRRDHVQEGRPDSVMVMNLADIQEIFSGITRTLNLLLGIIASISLVVGGIGIMNIMLVSVSERTKEIGLRKAVGATRFTILVQFLIESSVISLVGGALGILLGIAAALILGKAAGWAIYISPFSIILSFCFAAGIGILFGFWPAKKASLLSPIDALRYE